MKKMNLQRLVEVRSNLHNLVSLAAIIGNHDDIAVEIGAQLREIGVLRADVIDKKPEPAPEPLPVEAPVPVPAPKLTPLGHNHITRDIKKPGVCPGCDRYHDHQEEKRRAVSVRTPEKFEIPRPPGPSRKVAVSSSYNPERYVPYRVLWAKVIIRAAYDYALWKESPDLRLRKYAQDAERWLFESSDLELSFESICSSFDFPAERIRKKTRALTKHDVKKLEFRERHGRVDPGELTSGNDE